MRFKLLQKLPAGCEIRYTDFLYNRPRFLKANNDLPQLHYFWVDTESNSAWAHVAFSIEESEAISPAKAPFGGIEYADELAQEDLYTFIIFYEKELAHKGIRYLRLEQPPESYQAQSTLYEALTDLKYTRKKERVFQVIHVTEQPLLEQMALMEQRRFRKCVKAGIEFKVILPEKLSEVYHLIKDWRNRVGKPLSMSWEEMAITRKSNKSIYLPFGVFDQDRLVGATIGIRVTDHVLYHFYPAHDPEYHRYSPMVMVTNGLYEWAQSEGLKLLDLGTSYLNGKMNQSLFRFKSHVGGEESRAFVFRKVLSSR